MSNYVKATDFSVKDGLLPGNPAKIVKGTEIDDEFDAISAAIQTKADLSSPTFTGTPAAPTASPGTNTTQLATTAFAAAAVTAERTASATLTNKTLTSPTINGGTITGITDLAVADGGTGASSITANSVILGNGTNALNGNLVAPGSNGNVLTSNGTTWTSTAPSVSASSFTGSNQSLTSSGYQKLPGGLIIQWGKTGNITEGSSASVTFPTAFPNACFSVTTTANTSATSEGLEMQVDGVTTTGFTVYYFAFGSTPSPIPAYWIAIGW